MKGPGKPGFAEKQMKLEKYQEADETLYSRLVFNRETMNMNYGRIFTEEESKLLFQVMLDINASESKLGFYKVFISHENKDTFIGMGALTLNAEYDAIEIEYMLLPPYWNHGYGSELVGTLIQMATDTHVSPVLIALTDPSNLYSKRILWKYGFTLEKQYLNDDGDPVELYRRGI